MRISKTATATHHSAMQPNSAGYYMEFRTDPSDPEAGKPTAISVTVRDSRHEVFDNLAMVHEAPMHLFAISADLQEFYHLHPSRQSNGNYRVTHVFPYGGKYRLYGDITPENGQRTIGQNLLTVSGDARPALQVSEDENLTKLADGLRITLEPRHPVRAGEDAKLRFTVLDEGTEKPATDLQPYLGARAHFVVLSEDGELFLHVHPVEEQQSAGDHEAHDVCRVHHGGSDGEPSHVINAETRFPRAGLYKVWAQFRRHDRVITAAWVVRIN